MAGLPIFIFHFILFISSGTVYSNDEIWKTKMERNMEHVLSVLESQRSEISMLKDKVAMLEKICHLSVDEEKQETLLKPNATTSNNKQVPEENRSSLVPNPGLNKSQKRFLVPGEEVPVVAFYAFISKDFGVVGRNHIFVFDNIVTNQGNAYNQYSGTFTAPTAGIFAFSWTAYASGEHVAGETGDYGEISAHLVQNNQYKGSIYVDTETNWEEEMATGFAILHLKAGDVVMVTSPSGGEGSFHSNDSGRWSFSGFHIA